MEINKDFKIEYVSKFEEKMSAQKSKKIHILKYKA